MLLCKFNKTIPNRDSALDNQIVIHGKDPDLILEYTHGISNRLTGGSASANCLRTLVARGMGEGWSDALSIYLTQK